MQKDAAKMPRADDCQCRLSIPFEQKGACHAVPLGSAGHHQTDEKKRPAGRRSRHGTDGSRRFCFRAAGCVTAAAVLVIPVPSAISSTVPLRGNGILLSLAASALPLAADRLCQCHWYF
jgi:hypothetical protein